MDLRTGAIEQRIVDRVALTEYRPTSGVERRHPIVMVHGGCHGSWQWTHLQSWFAERGWSSTAIDWLAHGNSGALELDDWLHRGIPSVCQEIELSCATAQEAAGAAPIMMGHSMGGLAALAHAASTPRELAALVLLTPVVPEKFGKDPIELDVDFEHPWGPPPPDIARKLFYSGVDGATASSYYERLQPESPLAVWQATRWTVDVDLSSVRTPALVVAAGEDPLTPAEYVLSLAEAMAAESITLPGAGHGVTLDPGWPELCARIETWLSAVTESPAR